MTAVFDQEYSIGAPVGCGSMAEVFLTADPLPAPALAIKLMRSKHAERVTSRRRFDLEAKIACAASHPNLVRGLGAGVREDRPFLLMEYVPGVTLAAAIAAGPLDPDHASRVIGDVARALEHLYREHHVIAHRDVKPENIILAPAPRAVLCDLGIVLTPESRGWTASGALVGSPHYLAPEQWAAPDDVDQRVDVYALGALLYELLTSTKLFGGATPDDVRRRHGDAQTRRRMLADARVARWGDLIARCTAFDPRLRPTDPVTLVRELERTPVSALRGWWSRRTGTPTWPHIARGSATHGR